MGRLKARGTCIDRTIVHMDNTMPLTRVYSGIPYRLLRARLEWLSLEIYRRGRVTLSRQARVLTQTIIKSKMRHPSRALAQQPTLPLHSQSVFLHGKVPGEILHGLITHSTFPPSTDASNRASNPGRFATVSLHTFLHVQEGGHSTRAEADNSSSCSHFAKPQRYLRSISRVDYT